MTDLLHSADIFTLIHSENSGVIHGFEDGDDSATVEQEENEEELASDGCPDGGDSKDAGPCGATTGCP